MLHIELDIILTKCKKKKVHYMFHIANVQYSANNNLQHRKKTLSNQ